MTTSLWHRRRIERLAQLLDEASGGRRQRVRSPHDGELVRLVDIRHQLTELPTPEVDPEFRTGLRAMLVATAERDGIGATAATEPTPQRSTAHRRARAAARGPRARTALITGVTVGAVAFAGMSTASANAVPGDALYGVKRSTERAQLALASSDVGRAQLYLDFARTRLSEASTVTGSLERVLDDMDRDTSAGIRLLTVAATSRRDPAALDPIDPFVAQQREALGELAGRVNGTGLTRVEESLTLLDVISDRADGLRRDLDVGCPSAASIDALGPQPQGCITLPAPTHLGPSAPTAMAPPAAQPETGQPAPAGGGQVDSPTGSAPATAPAKNGGQSEPASDGDGGPTPLDAAAEEPSADLDSGGDGSDEGGLLSGLNRLVGNLLGG